MVYEKKVIRGFSFYEVEAGTIRHLMAGWSVVKPIHSSWLFGYAAVLKRYPTPDPTPMTVENFINHFRERHPGPYYKPYTRLVRELTAFAEKHKGSPEGIEELYTLFCISKNLEPMSPQ
jgi:hypothetical protein